MQLNAHCALQSGATRSTAMSFAQQCAIYVQSCASLFVQRFASLYLQRCATALVFRAPEAAFAICCSLMVFIRQCPRLTLGSKWVGEPDWFSLPLSAMLSNHCLCWCWLLVIASVGNIITSSSAAAPSHHNHIITMIT